MKKILAFAAVAALAATTQAATVSWSMTKVQDSPNNNAAAGWLVQIYDSSVAFDYAKAAADEITPWTSGVTTETGTTTKSYRASGTATLTAGSSKTIYAVIYDASSIASAKNYIVSDSITITAAANDAPVTASFGNMSGTATSNKFLNSSWTSTVPEPTTVALLALGLAAVGLKRKVA